MTSLLDIGPLTEEVAIGNKSVTVGGLTPEGFFYLLTKFPQLQVFFGAKNIDMAELQAAAPGAIAYALAIATTARDGTLIAEWRRALEKAAVIAANLSAHHQMMLLQAALRLTFPDGVGPFMEGVTALANTITRAATGKAPDMKSSKRSRRGFTTDSPGMRLGPPRRSVASTH